MIPDSYRGPVATETIDGIAYTSSKFPAMEGLRLMARTVAILGQTGLHAAVLAFSNKAKPSFMFALAEQVAVRLLEDPDLPRALLSQTKASALRPTGAGGPVAPSFDAHFSGEYIHLYSVIAFVLGHNFAGFTLGAPLPTGAPTSPPTPTGEPSTSQTQNAE